jgi:hypothetical protein
MFLNGYLDEVVYCHLHKFLYGLKQAPHALYQHFAAYLATLGFVSSVTNTALFVLPSGSETTYLLIYIDETIVTSSSTVFL